MTTDINFCENATQTTIDDQWHGHTALKSDNIK